MVKFTIFIVFVLFCGTLSGFLVPDGLQVVQTRLGEIHGMISSVDFDGHQYHVKKFLGIPYAEPPVGNLRFRKPLSAKPFTSPFMATKYSASCPQRKVYINEMSEDCLYLNAIVPMNIGGSSTTAKPVMVWIHGGGFNVGGAFIYDADKLSSFADTIVVTINYRLGAFGFFSTADQAAPGNYGLWDQQLALQWVHDNIAVFGGNPDMVTIFGGSAGSSSVIYHTAYPGNRGLFNRAIAESGTNFWASVPYNLNYKKSMEFADAVGCNRSSHDAIVSCLQNKSSAELEPYVIQDDAHKYPFITWVPVHDNDFVMTDPFTMFKNVSKQPQLFAFFHSVDLLIGWNNLDGLVYVPNDNTFLSANFTITNNQFENIYVPALTELSLQDKPTDLTKAIVLQEYTNFGDTEDTDEITKNVVQMATDVSLVAPTIQTVNAHVSKTSNTFVYRFRARPPYRFDELPVVLERPHNANHAEELLYVFGADLYKEYVFPDPSKVPQRTASEMMLTKTMMTMWGNFAKSGNPNKPVSIKPYYDVNWKAYTSDNPVFLDISLNMTQSSVMPSNNLRGVDFWNNIVPNIQYMNR